MIRRAPTAIYFEGADHVYPSLVMSAVIDILGIKNGGFDYDFENKTLNLIDTTNTVVRQIPIDDNGRMYVNYYGQFQTFIIYPTVTVWIQKCCHRTTGKIKLRLLELHCLAYRI